MRERIKEFRKSIRKLTMMDAAKELGITQATLSRIETGKQAISPQLAFKIEQWSNGWIRFEVKDLLKN